MTPPNTLLEPTPVAPSGPHSRLTVSAAWFSFGTLGTFALLAMILAAAVHFSPIECLMLGIASWIVGIVFLAGVTLWPSFLRCLRWGRYGRRPSMSGYSGIAWGIAFISFGILCVFNGYFSMMSKSEVGMLLLVNFILLSVGAVYDYTRCGD